MRRDKASCQRIHAKRRALQRFALDLDYGKQEEIIKLIQRGKAKFMGRDSIRVAIFAVEFEGTLLKVVYDSERKTLASVLPMNKNELSLCGCDHKHCLTPCGVTIGIDTDGSNELCPCDKCCCDGCVERQRI